MNETAIMDHRIIGIARMVATWSESPDRKTGVVVTTKDYQILAIGYEGLPMTPRHMFEEAQNIKLLHSELNALLQIRCAENGMRFFMWGGHPCSACASAICQKSFQYVTCWAIDENSGNCKDEMLAREILFRSNIGYTTIMPKEKSGNA